MALEKRDLMLLVFLPQVLLLFGQGHRELWHSPCSKDALRAARTKVVVQGGGKFLRVDLYSCTTNKRARRLVQVFPTKVVVGGLADLCELREVLSKLLKMARTLWTLGVVKGGILSSQISSEAIAGIKSAARQLTCFFRKRTMFLDPTDTCTLSEMHSGDCRTRNMSWMMFGGLNPASKDLQVQILVSFHAY